MNVSSIAYGADYEFIQSSDNSAYQDTIDELKALKTTRSYYSLVKDGGKKDAIEWYTMTLHGQLYPLYGKNIFKDQGYILFKALRVFRSSSVRLDDNQKRELSSVIIDAYYSLDLFGKYRFAMYFNEILEVPEEPLNFNEETMKEFDRLIAEYSVSTQNAGNALIKEVSSY